MTDFQTPPQPQPDPSEPSAGAVLEPGQTVSVRDAPDGWVEAAESAPTAGPTPVVRRRKAKRSTVPIRHEGAFVANSVAAATGFVSASAWYLLDVLDIYDGAWAAVLAALAIGCSVRAFSKANPTHRAVVSVLAYLLVLLIVLILLTHRDLVGLYGTIDDYRSYEQSLVRSRLQDPLRLAAYGIGGILSAVIPLATDRRRHRG